MSYQAVKLRAKEDFGFLLNLERATNAFAYPRKRFIVKPMLFSRSISSMIYCKSHIQAFPSSISLEYEIQPEIEFILYSLQIVEHEPSENWTLQIKFAQLRDSGVYECQVMQKI